MMKHTLLTLLVLSLSLALVACGDDTPSEQFEPGSASAEVLPDDQEAGERGESATNGADGEGNEAGQTESAGALCDVDVEEHSVTLDAACDDPACPCGQIVNRVTGLVQDASGAPVSGTKAQFCTRNARTLASVCLTPVDVAADGSFSINVPGEETCLYEGVLRALAPGQSYSTAYCTFEVATETVTDGTLDLSGSPAVLHPTELAVDLPPECVGQACMESTDEFVTVTFSDGLEIDVNPSWLFNGAVGLKDLSAHYIEGTAHLCNGAEIPGSPGTWAFSPEGDGFEIRFPARIPDKLGLADGTVVNLYIQGGIGSTIQIGDEKTECEEGTWTHFGCATVEGGVISLDEANGVPAIGWLTYAPAN